MRPTPARELVSRVTMADCERQTFRAGGPGGQNQNKRDTGVRIIHHPSGARGESREARTQGQNEKIAWRRMAESPEFMRWAMAQTGVVNAVAESVGSDIRIRTYNLVERRVVDHRTGARTSKVDEVLDGNLDILEDPK